MSQPQSQPVLYPITAFTLPKSGKSRNKLAQRFDHTVFVEVNLAELPQETLRDLLLEALQTKARSAVKKLKNLDTATEDEIKAAMTSSFEQVKQGKGIAGKVKPKMDPETKAIRAEARIILREAIKAKIEASNQTETFTSAQITSFISDYFKDHTAYHKNPSKFPEHEHAAASVDRALAIAVERIKQRVETGNILGDLSSLSFESTPKAPAKPRAKKDPAKTPTPKKAPSKGPAR